MSDWDELRGAVRKLAQEARIDGLYERRRDTTGTRVARAEADALIDKLEAREKSAKEALRGLLYAWPRVFRCECGQPGTRLKPLGDLGDWCEDCAPKGSPDVVWAPAVRAALAWLSGVE